MGWETLDEQIDRGYLCQHCHEEIDGEETGKPRNCIPCDSDQEDWRKDR